MHRYTPSAIARIVLAGLCVVWPSAASPARAADIAFAYLIHNGWPSLVASQYVRTDHQLTSWSATGALHPIVSGQKGPVQGTALMTGWSQSVADPYFASMGPLSVLITLDFGGFRAHLGMFDTPSGPQTTIGVVHDTGLPDPALSGVWAIGNGAGIAGGTASDLMVFGVVHVGTPQYQGIVPLPIAPYFPGPPGPPPATDPEPLTTYVQPSGHRVGSFYGTAQGPLRTRTRWDDSTNGQVNGSSMLVMHYGGSDYVILACTKLATDSYDDDGSLGRCSLSGTGPTLSRLTGLLGGVTGWWNLQLQPFIAP
ncbi:MAG: hypothetical protein IT179_19470 [Acidobacteria bacterium]|nr:hypothetical protein [Acidobacteriota bacterium]